MIIRAIFSGSERSKRLKKEYPYSKFVVFMESLVNHLKRKYPGKEVRIILLMDEGDDMLDYQITFHKKFRGVFQSSFAENVNIVLALYEFSAEWKARTSPWYNFFTPIELEPLEEKETYTLVQNYVKGAIEYKRGALHAIWDITQGHSYKVQKLCSRIFNSLGDRVFVSRQDVLRAQKELRKSSTRRRKKGS